MKINEIIKFTQELAPYETAAEWDNVGLLVGDENADAERILLALDITKAVIEEARKAGARLIISHHPVIFAPLSVLTPDDPAYLLAKYGIAALCLHTDLDRAENGVNTALAKALGLKNTELFPEDYICVGEPDKPFSADSFAEFVRERLNAPSVRYTDGAITRVAVSSGGGGEGAELYKKYGFDAFVTGEMKHHQYIFALEHGIAAFDAGHFPTEDVVIEPLRELLFEKFSEAEFIKSKTCTCPYKAV